MRSPIERLARDVETIGWVRLYGRAVDPRFDIGNRKLIAFEAWAVYVRDVMTWRRAHGGPPLPVLLDELGTSLEEFWEAVA